MGLKNHWQRVYTTRSAEEVSWFQQRPTVTAQLLDSAGLSPNT
jgi:hypothetical protein